MGSANERQKITGKATKWPFLQECIKMTSKLWQIGYIAICYRIYRNDGNLFQFFSFKQKTLSRQFDIQTWVIWGRYLSLTSISIIEPEKFILPLTSVSTNQRLLLALHERKICIQTIRHFRR